MKMINYLLDIFSLIFVPIFFYENIKLFFSDIENINEIFISFYILAGCIVIAGFYFIFRIILFFLKKIQC